MKATVSDLIQPAMHYWEQVAESFAKECGEACDHLFDYVDYASLETEEEQKEYKDCHYLLDVQVSFISPLDVENFIVRIKCVPFDRSKGECFDCHKQFPKTESFILKLFKDIYTEFYGQR